MKKFAITTLGCKVNQYESEAMTGQLTRCQLGDSAWTAATSGGTADVVVVNTCTVTGKAAMQSRQAIRQAVRTHPEARIIVTGCYAQTAPEEIAAIKGVDDIVDHKGKGRIPEMILSGQKESDRGTVRAVPESNGISNTPIAADGNRTRPFLKIQDGCNACCTYCIVPRARGKSQSLPAEAVFDEVIRLDRAGYHEVVLTGIHLGCYGLDLAPATRLYDLVQTIRARRLIDRIRLSSIEPCELNDGIVDLVAESDHDAALTPGRNRGLICPHFHIPLQSGDDRVLKAMGRPYDAAFFDNLVQRVHHRVPHAAIGVDVLVGFPGEDDTAFENTYRLIENLPLAYLHVFPFSARRGTPADTYPNRVHPATLKARCRRMRRLGLRKKKDFYRKFVGKRLEILIEGNRDADSGLLKGVAPNYLNAMLIGGDHLKNTLVDTRVDGLIQDLKGGIHGICQE